MPKIKILKTTPCWDIFSGHCSTTVVVFSIYILWFVIASVLSTNVFYYAFYPLLCDMRTNLSIHVVFVFCWFLQADNYVFHWSHEFLLTYRLFFQCTLFLLLWFLCVLHICFNMVVMLCCYLLAETFLNVFSVCKLLQILIYSVCCWVPLWQKISLFDIIFMSSVCCCRQYYN